MDIATLTQMGVALASMLAAGLSYAYWPQPGSGRGRDSMRMWLLAILAQALFWLLFTLGQGLPEAIRVVSTNTMAVLAVAGYVAAVRVFAGLKARAAVLLAWVAAVAAANYGFTVFAPSYTARVFVVSAPAGGLMLWLVWTLRRHQEPVLKRAKCLTEIVFLLGAGSLALRMADTLLHPERAQADSLPAQLALFYFVVLPVFASFGFLALQARRASAKLERLAGTDPLTGALNRRAFIETAQRAMDDCRWRDRPLSLLMIDLDHFKQINDDHGHATGDNALSLVERTLHGCLRLEDAVGRVGGEEFAVLLPGADLARGEAVAERIRASVEVCGLGLPDQRLALTVSVGVAERALAEDDVEPLLKRADQAMYAAKRAGRNRVAA